MTLDNELKESINFSLKYLRAYDKAKLLSAMNSWQQVYADDGSEELDVQPSVNENINEVVPDIIIATSGDQRPELESPSTEESSRKFGMGTKIILSIAAIWGVMIVVTMVKILL